MGHVLVVALMTAAVQLSSACFGFVLPPVSAVVETFEVRGLYTGHWGVDIASPMGADVRVVEAGVVRFSGVVVYNSTVSVDHGGGIVTTYSYLASRSVSAGDYVAAGSVVGVSGLHDGAEAYHFSLRLGGRYVDPYILRSCSRAPSRGLYLAVGGSTYPEDRARNIRRNIRPTPSWPPQSGEGRPQPAWS